MKKIFLIVLLVVSIFTLTGCGEEAPKAKLSEDGIEEIEVEEIRVEEIRIEEIV